MAAAKAGSEHNGQEISKPDRDKSIRFGFIAATGDQNKGPKRTKERTLGRNRERDRRRWTSKREKTQKKETKSNKMRPNKGNN